MKYPHIEGEAADSQHRGWIEVDELEWTVRRKITSHTGTHNDRESANAEITDLTLTRRMDSATPRLFIESCCGPGRTVTVRLTKTGTGSGADVFMEYVLGNALITSYEVDAIAQDTARPVETLTLSFVDLEMKYTPYDEDGNALAPVAVGFDTATNTRR
jgi:type VI secretion system secreted protein Hcp